MRTLLKNIYARIKPYNELSYWNSRHEPNAPVIPTDKHITFLQQQLKDDSKLLDFGPGIGRVFPAYRKCSSLTGYDISDQYQTRATQAAANQGIPFNLIIRKTLETDLPFETDEFDYVVTVGVLLHQKPDRIESLMTELARVGRKVILISYHEENPNRTLAPHVFLHPYESLCEKLGFTILHKEDHPEDNQIYLVFQK